MLILLLIFLSAMAPGTGDDVMTFCDTLYRSCIGQRFAKLELYALMVKLVQRFKMEYKGDDVGTLTTFVSVPDKPINIKFIER